MSDIKNEQPFKTKPGLLICFNVGFGVTTLLDPGLSAERIISVDICDGSTLAMHKAKCSSKDVKPVITKR